MSKRPKLDPIAAARLNEMGLAVWGAYQPEAHFIPNGRTLKRVAEPGDPWHVTLVRKDRVVWADGAQVARALAPTFEEAVEACVPTGLLASTMRCAVAVDKLTEAIRAS